jgi:hypothetical protein
MRKGPSAGDDVRLDEQLRSCFERWYPTLEATVALNIRDIEPPLWRGLPGLPVRRPRGAAALRKPDVTRFHDSSIRRDARSSLLSPARLGSARLGSVRFGSVRFGSQALTLIKRGNRQRRRTIAAVRKDRPGLTTLYAHRAGLGVGVSVSDHTLTCPTIGGAAPAMCQSRPAGQAPAQCLAD